MKKVLFTISIILTINFIVLAQTKEFQPYSSLGIKQGVNYSSVAFSPGVSQGITLGYVGGLVYKYQNERLFGLQIELNYIQKGWVEEIDFSKNEYERKMDYIELPFLTHVMLGKRALRYYVNLGTGFSYLLSEKESLNIVDEDLRREYYDTKIENEFDFSGIGDLGVVYHSKIGEFQVGFRYQYSFTDIFDKAEDRYYDQSQNSVISFSITYFIFSNQ